MRQRIITAFFLTVILSSLAGWLAGVKTDTRENRKKAEAPPVSMRNMLDSRFYSELGGFLDDRFPFRGLLIRIKNRIDYSIFNTSPSPKVILGRDGWLFTRYGLDHYFRDSCADREKMRRLARALNRLERVLEASGRRLVFVVAPNKSTIYPEHVGISRPSNPCGKSDYDLLLEAFREYPVRGFVRLDDLLIRAKGKSRVYYRTDSHWNLTGAIIASRAILEKIAPDRWKRYFPEMEFKDLRANHDLSGMIDMVGVDWREASVGLKGINYVSTIEEEQREPLENGLPRLSFTSRPTFEGDLLPRVIMYRDSFMNSPLGLLKGSFEHIDALWSYNVPVAKDIDLEDFLASRIVLIEVVERHLGVLDIRVD
ncbi:MAG: hypothetical protein ACE5EI_09405 [Thermodesulfobacteriota bacterium]